MDAWWGSRQQQVALLAHELQHALEIGRVPGARTSAEITELYRRIGYEFRDREFETVAAQRTGWLVDAELQPGLRERRTK